MRNYKKWRRQQLMLHGAEQLLSRDQVVKRVVKRITSSVPAKYVPSSLSEIQAGTNLESAKYSRVSFDPDVKYDDDPKAYDKPPSSSSSSSEHEFEDEKEVGLLANNDHVADVAMVDFSIHISKKPIKKAHKTRCCAVRSKQTHKKSH